MNSHPLISLFKANEHEPDAARLQEALATTWGIRATGGTPSAGRSRAEDAVKTIKRMLANQMSQPTDYLQDLSGNDEDAMEIEVANESAPDSAIQALRANFDSIGRPSLLDNLLDDNEPYGQAFHEDCEILWHTFDTKTPDDELRTDFLWVRAEYIRIKNYLIATRGMNVVISGQPGIGKTWMLNYLLMVRLEECQPVLFHENYAEYFHLFVDGKVYRVDEDYLKRNPTVLHDDKCAGLWILIDSAHYPPDGMIPMHLSNRGVMGKVIFASSPQTKRWEYGRQRGFSPNVIYMNPYSEAEARLLAYLYRTADDSRSSQEEGLTPWLHLSGRFHYYSPGPRSFIEQALKYESTPDSGMQYLEKESKTVLSQMSHEQREVLFRGESTIEQSNRVVCVHRDPKDIDLHKDVIRTFIVVDLLNDTVKTLLKEELLTAAYEQAQQWYAMVRRTPQSASVAGWMYEVLLLRRWMKDGKISLRLHNHDQRITPKQDAKNSPQYQFPLTKLRHDSALEIEVRHLSDGQDIPTKFEDLEENVLYFPYKMNTVAIDFLIRDKVTKTCYGLSATISTQHDVKEGLYDTLKELGLVGHPVKGQYEHVFVKDRREHLSVPCPVFVPSTGRARKSVWKGEFPFQIRAAILPPRIDE